MRSMIRSADFSIMALGRPILFQDGDDLQVVPRLPDMSEIAQPVCLVWRRPAAYSVLSMAPDRDAS